MLERKAVQASSIKHLGEASPRWRFRPRRPLLKVPRMRAPPLNSLPTIRVDARRAIRSLTTEAARGSPTTLVGVVVPLETDDQLRRSMAAIAAPGL